MPKDKQEQINAGERIQDALLKRWEKILEDESISAAEVAVIVKMLRDSGWTLDPTRLPQGIKDKLTEKVDPSQFDEDDGDVVVGRIA